MKSSVFRVVPAIVVVPLYSLLPTLMPFSPIPDTDPPAASVEQKTAPAPPSRRMSRRDYLVRDALTFRGTPYRFGGLSSRGIDCSGLTMTVYRRWGMLLPRTSTEQFRKGKPVPKSQMKPGDLVFFKNTYRKGISHVGIYVGNGQFVHAANMRKGVTVSSLAEPYYVNHWAGARRLALDSLPEIDDRAAE